MKNEKKKRIVALMVCASMLCSLAACSESGTNEETDAQEGASADSGSVEEELVVEEEEDTIETDNVPELNFNGAELRMAGQAYHVTNDMDMWVAEQTGDVVLDAIFERGLYIEDRFNVTITEPLMVDYSVCSSTIKSCVTSGDDAYEVVVNQLATSSSDVLNGYYLNLNDVKYIDFERSWYPEEITESATLAGKLFLTVSDMCLTYVGQTWSMAFDKTAAENYHIENLYDCVREGTWTYDKLYGISSGIYTDLNGDGTRDEGDYYGMTFGSSFDGCKAAAFIYGADERFLTINENYEIENLLGSERGYGICEKILTLMDSEGYSKYTTESYALYGLMEGHFLFASSQLGHYYYYGRDFDGEFGVLPLPKYDESQEDYYTLCDAGCNCITVPITCGNTDLAGAAIEAMSQYSHNYVNPAFVDVALQTKTARDKESAEMMQIVLDGRVMDFGYLYCGWSGWTWQLGSMYSGTDVYMSTFEKLKKAQTKTYEKVIKCFEIE